MNNEPNLAGEIELPLVKEEIKAFAFNTHKIIKAKKYGRLNNFLCARFNVTSKEAINLYLNENSRQKTPKHPRLLRK